MTSIAELTRWIDTLNPVNSVCIDDGALTIAEIDSQTGMPTGAELGIGGLPDNDEFIKAWQEVAKGLRKEGGQ